ncbi:MAG: Zn-ribbon domain-containing OB-fold protein [Acidimicrobiia bacterium]|nr:MAG: Zn-ribbon domain-containing OB-fold protein [Acidimicrobiia bacterium]
MIHESAIKLPFSYAAGGVGSRFLIALRDDQTILGARCASCSTITAPARSFCSNCNRAVNELVEVGPGGTLEAWTDQPGTGIFGLIHLDGADTALVHRLTGSDAWQPGTRVMAVFAEERTGRITDIEGFTSEGDST